MRIFFLKTFNLFFPKYAARQFIAFIYFFQSFIQSFDITTYLIFLRTHLLDYAAHPQLNNKLLQRSKKVKDKVF